MLRPNSKYEENNGRFLGVGPSLGKLQLIKAKCNLDMIRLQEPRVQAQARDDTPSRQICKELPMRIAAQCLELLEAKQLRGFLYLVSLVALPYATFQYESLPGDHSIATSHQSIQASRLQRYHGRRGQRIFDLSLALQVSSSYDGINQIW